MMMPSEAASIGILVVALAVAGWRWRKTRAPYFLWLTWLVGDLVVREIHFSGTSPVFYIALSLILYIGLIYYSRMAEYFASPPLTLFSRKGTDPLDLRAA
jgi:hypothetical protein